MAASQNMEHGSMKQRFHALEAGAKSSKSDGDFFLQKATQDSNTKISVVDCGLLEIMNSEGSKENRKMTVSRQKNTTDYNEAHKRSSPEIGEWIDQIPSIHIEQTDPNNDSYMDSSLPRSESELGNIYSAKNRLIEQTPEERKNSSVGLGCKKKEILGYIEVYEGKDVYGNCQDECKKVDEVYPMRKILCHTNEHTCDVCGKVFECFSELEDHYSDHEDYHFTFCRICKSDIDEHRAASKWKGKFKCCYQECTYESNNIGHLRSHLYTHSNLYLFKCEKCGNRYRTKASLNQHSKTPCQMWKNL